MILKRISDFFAIFLEQIFEEVRFFCAHFSFPQRFFRGVSDSEFLHFLQRTEFLTLINLIIQNAGYGEHQHRRQELERCFHKIAREDGYESDVDQQMVCKILESYPQYFTRVK